MKGKRDRVLLLATLLCVSLPAAAWLIKSRKAILDGHRSLSSVKKLNCASNLRFIGQGLFMYAAANGGRYPDSLAMLYSKKYIGNAAVFVCPDGEKEISRAAATQWTRDEVNELPHCSYVYLGRGLAHPLSPNLVVAYERLENHGGLGIHVLKGDGRVDFISADEAKAFLAKLSVAGRPPSRPSIRTGAIHQ